MDLKSAVLEVQFLNERIKLALEGMNDPSSGDWCPDHDEGERG